MRIWIDFFYSFVNLIKPDGVPDIEPILESLRGRSAYVDRLFAQYIKQPLPISTLADALGSDVVTLLLEWPRKHAKLFVSSGTQAERDQGRELLKKDGQRYVLDLVTISELARHNLLEAVEKVIGKPLVPQTLKEQIRGLLQLIDTHKKSSNMREENGRFYITDIPAEYYKLRRQFLQKLLDFIDTHCEVVPTFGPDIITKEQRMLAQLLDNTTVDAVYLALERDAALLSEDGALRHLATLAGLTNSLGLQPLFMHLRDAKYVQQSEYSRIIIEKLSLGHDFVSVDSGDLFWAANKCNKHLSPEVGVVLETFKRPSLDLHSGIIVCAGLLRDCASVFQPSLVKEYFKECCSALSYGRVHSADTITSILRMVLIRVLISSKRAGKVSKPQQALLNQLSEEELQSRLKQTKVALAIQGLFRY